MYTETIYQVPANGDILHFITHEKYNTTIERLGALPMLSQKIISFISKNFDNLAYQAYKGFSTSGKGMLFIRDFFSDVKYYRCIYKLDQIELQKIEVQYMNLDEYKFKFKYSYISAWLINQLINYNPDKRIIVLISCFDGHARMFAVESNICKIKKHFWEKSISSN